MKTCESSTATLRALLVDPSLRRDAVERTFDVLADANADTRELDEVVRSGMDVSPDDEDAIRAELAALEAEAKAEKHALRRIRSNLWRWWLPALLSVSDVTQRSPEQIDTRDLSDAPNRRPEQVLG